MTQMIFDVGMFNGQDTGYYLELGFRVVSVEANPVYVSRALTKFAGEIASGQLTVVHGAMCERHGTVTLHVSGDEPGSSSILPDWVSPLNPVGTYDVQGVLYDDLVSKHGIPHFMKVDIEGADRFCVLAITRATAPKFLSFEIGRDFDELFDHLVSIGFTQFKIINQTSFRSIENARSLRDRLTLRALHLLGYENPTNVRRRGRYFRISTSGPVPWLSDGRWVDAGKMRDQWRAYVAAGGNTAWYDLQASRD